MNLSNWNYKYDNEPEVKPEGSAKAREILAVYDRTITSKLNDPARWYDLGIALAKSGWSELAAASLVKSLEIRPRQPLGWYYLGVTLIELVRFKDAALAFDRALEIDPANPDAWLDKGRVLEILDRPDEALNAYNKCLALDAYNAEALYLKRIIDEDTSDEGLPELLDGYDKILKQNLHDSRIWFNKGFVLAEMFKCEEAMTAFESFLELHPDDMLALTRVGVAAHKLAMSQEAANIFQEALKFNPQYSHAWYYKGEANWSLGPQQYYAVAYAAYDKASQSNHDHYLAWYGKGCVLAYYAGEYDRALDDFDKVAELQPDWAQAWQDRGWVLAMLNKYDEALESYTKAIELAPDNYEAWYNRAGFFSANKDFQNALDDLAKAIGLHGPCKTMALKEDAFYPLRNDARFLSLVNLGGG